MQGRGPQKDDGLLYQSNVLQALSAKGLAGYASVHGKTIQAKGMCMRQTGPRVSIPVWSWRFGPLGAAPTPVPHPILSETTENWRLNVLTTPYIHAI